MQDILFLNRSLRSMKSCRVFSRMLRFILLPMLLSFAASTVVGDPPQAGEETPAVSVRSLETKPETSVSEEVAQLIADLGSPEFGRRQAAVATLRDARDQQLHEICQVLETGTESESARRIIEVLELRYEQAPLDSDDARITSEALEKSSHSDRWFVSETARDVLDRHWRRRTEIAVVELVSMKVPLSPLDPTELWKQNPNAPEQMFGQADPTSSRHLKIYIDKNWPGNDRAFELLRRLDSLQTESFMTQPRLVSIYLIDGHPLAIEQVAILKGTFGDTQIAERGRVCLGVLNEPRFGVEEGILVGSVQKGSSADAAEIRSGDLIVAMNGKKLTDFDQLVTQLRSFDVGDKIMLHIRSSGLQDEGGSRSVEVTLKGWH
jgi:hypothetical protein